MNQKNIKRILIGFIIVLFGIIIVNNVLLVYQKNIDKNEDGWEKYENNPVLGDELTGSVFDPYVFVDENGTYRMYVSWRKKGAIAVTTSEDGINWSELKIVLDKDTSTGWEDIVNRATVVYKDGLYHMWYTGQSNRISKIGYATSEDGYIFNKRNEPVIINEKEWEKDSVMNPHVIYDEEENVFKMWYAAGETYEPDVIAYATSKDGINWDKYSGNPILKANENKSALDSFKVGGCDVHKLSNDSYIMFYIGYTDINTARIFVAKSQDGINWVRTGKPIIVPEKGKFDSEACYKPSAILDSKNNRWMLWYNGRTLDREYIGLAIYNKDEI